ncbi:unnamed protein product [Durusdinium trenchii]|uniref:TauD/TfdA-like domain-containing protein n=2 Tax=Durusdinium trenchii TaxID=1381693 RepID=A0ABP0HTH6_9DINO
MADEDWSKSPQTPCEFSWQLPLMKDTVESIRFKNHHFGKSKIHEIVKLCWANMLKDARAANVVSINITDSRPWPKVIAGAPDKIRGKLVGTGIVQCHLEMDRSRINPNLLDRPQPNFVLTYADGWKAIWHPGSKGDGFLAFKEPGGQLHGDDLRKEDITLAFRLAAGWEVQGRWEAGIPKSFSKKKEEFQRLHRPNGWTADDFQIGASVWAWVLRPEPKADFLAFVNNPCGGTDAEHAEARKHSKVRDDETQSFGKEVAVDLEGDHHGVEIYRAITAQGEHLPLEEALHRIRLAMVGQRATMAKDEPPEEALVPVRVLRFTQEGCSATFRGGPYQGQDLEVVIQDLIKGKCDPTRDDWLTLEVVKWDGTLYSNDNRRLHCLKEAQTHHDKMGTGKEVQAKVKIYHWTEQHSKYVEHLDTKCDGKRIQVRRGVPDWVRSKRRRTEL